MHHAAHATEDPRLRNLANRRICASLLLQQLLYYQVFFSIGWILFWMVWLFKHYWVGLTYTDGDVARMALMSLWCVSEPIRLSAGWYGNLQENLPWLILFCILTFVPLHAVIYYIMLASFDVGPWSQAVQYAQAIITEVELLVGIYACIRMYRMQKQQFYQFEYVLNQRRRNMAYNVDGTSRAVPNLVGSGIGSNGPRRQTIVG